MGFIRSIARGIGDIVKAPFKAAGQVIGGVGKGLVALSKGDIGGFFTEPLKGVLKGGGELVHGALSGVKNLAGPVLTVAGGVAGFMFGGPFGAMAGAQLGGMLGGAVGESLVVSTISCSRVCRKEVEVHKATSKGTSSKTITISGAATTAECLEMSAGNCHTASTREHRVTLVHSRDLVDAVTDIKVVDSLMVTSNHLTTSSHKTTAIHLKSHVSTASLA